MSWQGGPVNWDLARDVARQAVAQAGDRSVSAAERQEVADAMRLAELWLDAATSFPAGASAPHAWSRAEWGEATLPAWRGPGGPIAAEAGGLVGGVVPRRGGPMAPV